MVQIYMIRIRNPTVKDAIDMDLPDNYRDKHNKNDKKLTYTDIHSIYNTYDKAFNAYIRKLNLEEYNYKFIELTSIETDDDETTITYHKKYIYNGIYIEFIGEELVMSNPLASLYPNHNLPNTYHIK